MHIIHLRPSVLDIAIEPVPFGASHVHHSIYPPTQIAYSCVLELSAVCKMKNWSFQVSSQPHLVQTICLWYMTLPKPWSKNPTFHKRIVVTSRKCTWAHIRDGTGSKVKLGHAGASKTFIWRKQSQHHRMADRCRKRITIYSEIPMKEDFEKTILGWCLTMPCIPNKTLERKRFLITVTDQDPKSTVEFTCNAPIAIEEELAKMPMSIITQTGSIWCEYLRWISRKAG